jgi:hypothetical protein
MPLAGLDLARLQRAAKGTSQSTGGGGDDVVEGGGLRLIGAGSGLLMLGYFVMDPKHHWLAPRRKIGAPKRALNPFDSNLGGVDDRHSVIVTRPVRAKRA